MGLAIGLVVAACGDSSSTSNPAGNLPGANASVLTAGLAANLDKLDSYQFRWQMTASSATATSKESGNFETSGTVVNKPVRSYKIDNMGMAQIIVVGDKSWVSYDNGSTWTQDSTYATDPKALQELLPTSYYGTNFDSNAAQFKVVGEENKNSVACIHYQSKESTGAGGAAFGAAATFQADLWVARDGSYPVSGFYGWTARTAAGSGTWGYSFDITNVNSPSNKIEAPTNVSPTD
jgi:outer membrane lipoprotein-sorting protein